MNRATRDAIGRALITGGNAGRRALRSWLDGPEGPGSIISDVISDALDEASAASVTEMVAYLREAHSVMSRDDFRFELEAIETELAIGT